MGKILTYNENTKIWLTSDLHLGHNKDFVYEKRGFQTVEEMNEQIIANLQAKVHERDYLFILGDLMLGGAAAAPVQWLKQLPGKVYIILGNHDTEARETKYIEYFGDKVVDAMRLRYKAANGHTYYFYLSHYPTLVANYDDFSKPLSARLLNLYGHTHQTSNFYNQNPFMYHVGMDSHSCQPVEIETVITDIKNQYNQIQKENKDAEYSMQFICGTDSN